MREGIAVVVIALALCVASASATAPDEIVPFQQVVGMRLGMTESQAKQGVGEKCPTLTARTRRDRVKYPCYFTTAPVSDGTVELIYGSRARGCGAAATLLRGRLLDVSSSCSEAIRGGPGTGSSFRDMYRSFRSGSVRCSKRPPLVVYEVTVGKCRSFGWSGPHNTGSPNPCSKNFAVRARFRGEFTP